MSTLSCGHLATLCLDHCWQGDLITVAQAPDYWWKCYMDCDYAADYTADYNVAVLGDSLWAWAKDSSGCWLQHTAGVGTQPMWVPFTMRCTFSLGCVAHPHYLVAQVLQSSDISCILFG